MVIPNHADATISNYSVYAAARGADLAIPQGSLLPISVPRMGGLTYGLHPNFGTGATNAGIHPLWAQGKMAVAAKARGRGFGDLLMDACIAFARERAAHRVIIVSNTVLEPAIRLYRKHGFVQVPLAKDARYERANIRLEMELQPTGRVSHHEAAAR
jgi:GNAT superfamily N-acetyltransferase